MKKEYIKLGRNKSEKKFDMGNTINFCNWHHFLYFFWKFPIQKGGRK